MLRLEAAPSWLETIHNLAGGVEDDSLFGKRYEAVTFSLGDGVSHGVLSLPDNAPAGDGLD